MKTLCFTLALLCGATVAAGRQLFSSAVEIVTTYSQNGRFRLRSIPFDNEEPSLRGRTAVYREGQAEPIYVFERGFDSVSERSNNLVLSDDGEVIFYAIEWGAQEEQDGLKSVNIYRRGQLVRSYSETELNGCDKRRERCSLVYSNDDEVVDRKRTEAETGGFGRVFKDGVSEQERFLSDFALFSSDDAVYLTDSKKQVHVFDLKEGRLARSEPFASVYEQLKARARYTRTELQRFEAPTFFDLPKLRDGRDAEQALAAHLGMKLVDTSDRRDGRYKWHRFKVSAYLLRDGSVEVEELEADPDLPGERIREFFTANRFDGSVVPAACDRWHIRDQYVYLRKKDDRLARRERREEEAGQREEYARRLTAESIGGVYIPRDLGECLTELDKLLSEVDRKEIESLTKREEMAVYHLGLGMWLRNNWGLWGGSRLQKYFLDRGVTHPDEMSGVILDHYHDWLHGKTETWKEWEKKIGKR